jgi:hypothetical protein
LKRSTVSLHGQTLSHQRDDKVRTVAARVLTDQWVKARARYSFVMARLVRATYRGTVLVRVARTSRAMTEEAKSHLCAHGVEPEDDDEGLPC